MAANCHSDGKRFLSVLWINILVFMAELTAGIHSGSLSMISDSLHLSIHIAAPLVALISESELLKSCGKVKILTAGFNIFLFFVLSAVISHEAYYRLLYPPEVDIGFIFFAVAVFGLIANIYTVKILHTASGQKGTINRKILYRHMIYDTAGSCIVIAGAVAILATGFYRLDPVLSFILAGFIFFGAIAMSQELFGYGQHCDHSHL